MGRKRQSDKMYSIRGEGGGLQASEMPRVKRLLLASFTLSVFSARSVSYLLAVFVS